MSKGNVNTSGNKKNNFPYQQSVLLLLGALQQIATTSSTGLAQESTLISVLNAIITTQQDVEILLVRDTGNGDVVVQQITDYSGGAPVVTYRDVNGNPYVPVGPLEYLDPAAIQNLILLELQTLNANVATEATLAALDAKFNSIPRTPSLTRIAGVASANVAAGARSVSFFNAGPTNATVAGGTLLSGESITFSAGGQNDVLAAIPYTTVATGDLMIVTVV